MPADEFNENADPSESEGAMTQAEAKKLYAEARQYAYPPARKLEHYTLRYITDPDAPGAMAAMEKMYKLYAKVFPIEEERESMDSLVSLLRANKGRDGHDGKVPCREQWVLVENDKGEVVAANNSMVFSAVNNPEVSRYVGGTTHLNYTFVDPAYRGQGHAEIATGYSYDKAREFIASTYKDGRKAESVPMLEVAEQNAALKMTPEEILVDTAGAQTDQSKRRDIFQGWGFGQLDLPSPYVQLPLEPRAEGGASATGMDLVCRGVPAPKSFLNIASEPAEIPSEVIKFHLHEFMDQGVAKGKYDIETDPDWIMQAKALDAVPTVKVLDNLDHLGMKDALWAKLDEIVHAKKFDADAVSNKTMGEIMGVEKIGPKPAMTTAPATKPPRFEYAIAG
jgi:hypothetical protein